MRNGAILIGYKLIALLLIMVWNISMIKIDANRSKPDPVVCCLFLFFFACLFYNEKETRVEAVHEFRRGYIAWRRAYRFHLIGM